MILHYKSAVLLDCCAIGAGAVCGVRFWFVWYLFLFVRGVGACVYLWGGKGGLGERAWFEGAGKGYQLIGCPRNMLNCLSRRCPASGGANCVCRGVPSADQSRCRCLA
jgi:hypothetical protein